MPGFAARMYTYIHCELLIFFQVDFCDSEGEGVSNGGSRSDRMRDVLHSHNDTSSSVNSTGWTWCQGKDFLSGEHGEFIDGHHHMM